MAKIHLVGIFRIPTEVAVVVVSGAIIEIPDINLLQMLERTAVSNPQKTATIFAGQEMTYGQLYGAVLQLMGKLQSCGITPGDRVGVMLPNCPQYVIAYYAVVGVGGILVQVNPMSVAQELVYLIEDSGMKLLFAYDKLLETVAAARNQVQLGRVCGVRLGDSDATLPAPEDGWFDEWLRGTAPLHGLPEVPADTVAVLQYTGGTTGRPKGAMLTHRNLVANAVQSTLLDADGLKPTDIIVCALPFFHVYAMTVCMNLAVVSGIAMLIVPRFVPTELIGLIETYQPTLFPAVPTMYVALTQALPPGSDSLRSVRLCECGGAPMPQQVMIAFEAVTGATVLEGYGLSEASPVTHFNPSRQARKLGSIGLPIVNTESKIVSLEDGHTELTAGEVGELAVRGPQVMKGYWRREEETSRTLVDGWLMTGDVGTMDTDGYTFIVDRKKDLIIASGYNVYPRDVEEVLYQHPAVLEAAVIGVPDAYRGETVKAFIVQKPGQSVTSAEVEQWCRERLASYKVPRIFEFCDSLPKSAVGKILRRALRST